MSKSIEETKSWIQNFVIALNLCPFASSAIIKNNICFISNNSKDLETLLETFGHFLYSIKSSPQYKSGIFITPFANHTFLEYLDFYTLCESLLEDLNLDDTFQLASFHPKYQFAGTEPEDVSNYTNRSPYPMIHVLSLNEVSDAIDTHKNVNEIPAKNIALLNNMGIAQILDIISH